MNVGDLVEVHTRFDDAWADGFEIAELVPEGYRLRRLTDRALLPGFTSEADIRPLPMVAARGSALAGRPRTLAPPAWVH